MTPGWFTVSRLSPTRAISRSIRWAQSWARRCSLVWNLLWEHFFGSRSASLVGGLTGLGMLFSSITTYGARAALACMTGDFRTGGRGRFVAASGRVPAVVSDAEGIEVTRIATA